MIHFLGTVSFSTVWLSTANRPFLTFTLFKIWYFHCIFLTDIISHCSSDMLFPFFHNFHIFRFSTMRWPTSPLGLRRTCSFIWYLNCILLTDIIRHCSNDMLFSFFHNFHIFHFPTMRWPTSPLASDGPVPHRLHDPDTHLLYDLYPPVL